MSEFTIRTDTDQFSIPDVSIASMSLKTDFLYIKRYNLDSVIVFEDRGKWITSQRPCPQCIKSGKVFPMRTDAHGKFACERCNFEDLQKVSHLKNLAANEIPTRKLKSNIKFGKVNKAKEKDSY